MFRSRQERRDATAHVITMIAIVATFFGLLWFAVVILNAPADTAFLVSLVTLVLLGLGVMFTTSAFKGGDDQG